MGLFDFLSGNKGPKKPKKYFEVNPGTYKVQVHDTNDTQELLSEQRSHIMKGTSGLAIALCERTPEQIEAKHPDEHCINVCTRNSKTMTESNYLGYIDVDRAKAGYLKDLVKEYQLVEAHASMTDNGGKYRMNVLLQPPDTRKKQKQQEKLKKAQQKR
ncbi:MAG: hypothetical protein Q4D27_05830 [Coriobacteriia bacterium]|nr:hypothetical protein [Coriobacteriia bacterium]